MEKHGERTFQVRYTIKIDEMDTGHIYGHGGSIPLYCTYYTTPGVSVPRISGNKHGSTTVRPHN